MKQKSTEAILYYNDTNYKWNTDTKCKVDEMIIQKNYDKQLKLVIILLFILKNYQKIQD